MPMIFMGGTEPMPMIFIEEPEIVIVMNPFEGPKFVSIISLLGGPEI